MKTFNSIFLFLLLCAYLIPQAGAQDRTAQRNGWLKAWREKRHSAEQSNLPSAGIKVKLDVPYLNDDEPLHQLDIYLPADSNKLLPALFHIHGGGWKIGDKKLMRETGMFYASKGILFITPNYRLSPKVRHPAHVEDCAAALSWVFKHAAGFGADTSRIFISGHSAGAHLAALLGTDAAYLKKHGLSPERLAGVIPVDTATFNLLSSDNEPAVKGFISQAFDLDAKTLKSASPFYNVSVQENYPKFLILNTTNRESAARDGKEFADKLKNVNCDVRFIPVNNHTHREMATGMCNAADPVGSAILNFILPPTN